MPNRETLSLFDAQNLGLLGSIPLPDMRYLLAPIDGNPAPKAAPTGPSAASDFIAIAHKTNGDWSAGETEQAWLAWGDWQAKSALEFPKLWARVSASGQTHWEPLTGDLPREPSGKLSRVAGIALSWELTALLSVGAAQQAQELARNVRAAEGRVARFGWTLAPSETSEAAARRAEWLIRWKTRFARPVEMRLVPQKTPFWAQTVWRCAYALGMEWTSPHGGESRARFAWPARSAGVPLFFVGVNEAHGVLTPEKATMSETVPGLVFYFELPSAPAPVETFDRMVLAVNYFAHTLNGRPVSAGGADLDGDALDGLREELSNTVAEMVRLGLAPGSPEATRFF